MGEAVDVRTGADGPQAYDPALRVGTANTGQRDANADAKMTTGYWVASTREKLYNQLTQFDLALFGASIDVSQAIGIIAIFLKRLRNDE